MIRLMRDVRDYWDMEDDNLPKSRPDGCAVPGCMKTKGKRGHGRFCDMHDRRRHRIGSPTAMRCRGKCKRIFDDDTTANAKSSWTCSECLGAVCARLGCGNPLKGSGKSKQRIWCSRKCLHIAADAAVKVEWRINEFGSIKPKLIECRWCKKVFRPKIHHKRSFGYCTKKCRGKFKWFVLQKPVKTDPVFRSCKICGLRFEIQSKRGGHRQTICSKGCRMENDRRKQKRLRERARS